MSNKQILFVIDPQNDFMDSPNFKGSLAVPGSYEDMKRLSSLLNNVSVDNVMITLDTHSREHIAHQLWWINEKGENPTPFTIISVADVENGTWKAAKSADQDWSVNYVKTLADKGKYPLCIWPFHCIKGTEGFDVEATFAQAVTAWENRTGNKATYINKGHNDYTEHYSGLSAEVPVPNDPTTQLNMTAIQKLSEHDTILVAGEALSHCVAYTTLDLISNLPEKDRSKVVLLTDTMSPVGGFEQAGKDFFEKAEKLGAKLMKSDSFFKTNKMRMR